MLVHITLMHPEEGIFHAHGTYLPSKMTFDQLIKNVPNTYENMKNGNTESDENVNVTVNALMMGL